MSALMAPSQARMAKRAQAFTKTNRPQRIYYVNPLLFKGLEEWTRVFAHARQLGFDSVLSAPLFARGARASVFVARTLDQVDAAYELGTSLEQAVGSLTQVARDEGIQFMLDLVVDRMATHEPAAISDPRVGPLDAGATRVDLEHADNRARHLDDWRNRLSVMANLGVNGFRLLGIGRVPTEFWKNLIADVRGVAPATAFLAWTPGTGFEARRALVGLGIDAAFSSLAWWNMRDSWFAEEFEIQQDLGYQIAFPEPPFGRRVAHGIESFEILKRKASQALRLAAQFGALMVPAGYEFGATIPLDPMHGDGRGIRGLRDQAAFDLSPEIRELNRHLDTDTSPVGALQLVPTSQSPVVAMMQTNGDHNRSSRLQVSLVNRDLRKSAAAPMKAVFEHAAGFLPLKLDASEAPARLRLQPGEIVTLTGEQGRPVTGGAVATVQEAAHTPRLAIEAITPSVDEGRFPVKRVVGQTVIVEADIFADTHDPLSAALFWRTADSDTWVEVPMEVTENDRWRAEFTLARMGRHEFAVEAWRNTFGIYRYELAKKHDAHLDLTLEIQEGINLVHDAIVHSASEMEPNVVRELELLHRRLGESSQGMAAEILLSPQAFEVMKRADRRPFRVRSAPFALDAERRGAAFANWYEIFPRSQSGDPHRHGTFDDVIAQLPRVRSMGFDVLYFPPIHPIGTTNRKGRNNSLKAGPDDPGSPYAIGSPDGGHDAIHPQLGTFEDFRRLVAAAADQGIELALDLAIQASPDHPWLTEKPGWFAWRPDGTIRYAENPPKKYEDIVNVDFYGRDAVPGLWVALRDTVQLWVDQGVKLFRVDNPHTKPFPFWEWLIADIRSRDPDVVFLSEAFTRPKVMYRLAKVGFSQSYTYFTWRNTRHELETYMTELTTQAPKDFFRPHFFVNTHDINPDFLQNAPRSAYMIRAGLAATLSGLWGVYNGFELCEGRPDVKRKEYADSEKYEIRAWNWDRPGNIIGEITMLNRIRKENAAFHSHLGLTLLPSSNPNVMFFEKATAGRENVVFVAVNLDPYNYQESDVEVPLWQWNIHDHGSIELDDLVSDEPLTWHSKWQRLRLDPHALPFCIYRPR